MLPENQIEMIPGTDVYDTEGAKIGRAGTVYVDDDTGKPEWATVHTGLLGTRESFMPISRAELHGDRLTVPYTKQQVKDAPSLDPDGGHLSLQEEQRLYDHYGLRSSDQDAYGRRRGSGGRESSRGETDDAMTRSEERLNVGTRQQETGRARLRKYVVTEQQSVQVPVSREEVRVEREPVSKANRGAGLKDPDLSEAELEVTLHEERPVVEKEAVPVERVRLAKKKVTGEKTVRGEVRKEKIDTEGVDETPNG
jgi:uncharacterized protein (TIGR02271 family)